MEAAAKPAEKKQILEKAVPGFKKLIDSTAWGYVNDKGYYILGSMLLEEKLYAEARECYAQSAKKAGNELFVVMSLLQSAHAAECAGDDAGAFTIYTQLEKKYPKTVLRADVLYDLGRAYQKKKDNVKAKEYFEQLITLYPNTLAAYKAKKRLFLVGYDASVR